MESAQFRLVQQERERVDQLTERSELQRLGALK
jgi:hypothetical protein